LSVKLALSGGLGTYVAQAGISFDLNGKLQQSSRLIFTSVPSTSLSGSAVHLTQLSLTLQGNTGAPAHPLVTNPSACPATSVTATTTATASDGSSAQAVTPYPVTNCAAVQVSQTLDASFTDPTAGHLTNATVTTSFPLGSSAVSGVSFGYGQGLGYNWGGAIGDTSTDACPVTSNNNAPSFDPSSCPPQAKIGTVTLTSPLFAAPLSGKLYVVQKSPVPLLAYDVNAGGARFRASIAQSFPQIDPNCDPTDVDSGTTCYSQIQITMTTPPIPLTQISIAYSGDAGRMAASGNFLSTNILALESGPCVSPKALTTKATALRGTPNPAASTSVSVANC
jgi:hypothetical protein